MLSQVVNQFNGILTRFNLSQQFQRIMLQIRNIGNLIFKKFNFTLTEFLYFLQINIKDASLQL